MERITVFEEGSCAFIDIPTYSCCLVSMSIIR